MDPGLARRPNRSTRRLPRRLNCIGIKLSGLAEWQRRDAVGREFRCFMASQSRDGSATLNLTTRFRYR